MSKNYSENLKIFAKYNPKIYKKQIIREKYIIRDKFFKLLFCNNTLNIKIVTYIQGKSESML